MGGTALRLLQGVEGRPRVSEWRGRVPKANWPDLGPGGSGNLKVVWATFHPSHVLRQESRGAKRVALRRFASDMGKVARVVALLRERRDG
jgi:uracil-DNA glycosylase